MKNLAIKLFLGVLLLFFVSSFSQAFAQTPPPKEETIEAVVKKVVEEKEVESEGRKQLLQKLDLVVTKGSIKGREVKIENNNILTPSTPKYKEGDKVMVSFVKNPQGKDSFYITDYIRRFPLFLLFALFLIIALFITRKQGAASFLGMGISFLAIFLYILPQISKGENPVVTVIIGSLFIVPATFFLSHGINKKTLMAVIGTFISLTLTGLLAMFFVDFARLTGFASEEANFLQVEKQGLIPIKGLLLSGIIVGALGILDDITISQSAIVYELKKANEKLKFFELYKKAMNIGKDHISSLVNTLILVYAGAALPLLLLFVDSSKPLLEVINNEMIAEEIVRTLVASIGLILAVPITTFIAALEAGQKTEEKKK